MKKGFKKRMCAVGLVATSVFAGVAAPMVVSIANAEKTEASTNGKTADDAIAWLKSSLGKKYGDGECVDLIKAYYQYLGQSVVYGNAESYQWNDLPAGWQRLQGVQPQKGDIIVCNVSGKHGHVAIYENDSCTYHQNFGTKKYVSQVSYHYTDWTNTYWGVIRPDFSSDTPQPLKGSPIGGGSQTISDGDYHIVSALNNSMGVDVYGNKNADGTNVNLYSNLNDTNQIFTVKYLGNGFYSIRHKSSGKMLDVYGASLDYGANTHIFSSNNSDAQKWVIKISDDAKYFYILSKCNGLYLDVESGNATNGTNIRMWGGNGSAAQKWKFIACGGTQTVSDGDYHIVSALDNTMGIDVYGNDNKDGTNIQLYKNVSDPNQVFSVKYIGSGYYQLTHKYTGKSIDMYGNNSVSGTNIHLHSSNGSDAQKWILRSVGNGYYSIIGKGSGLFLDVTAATAANYTNIQGYVGNDTLAQKWRFVPAEIKVEKVNIPYCAFLGSNAFTFDQGYSTNLGVSITPDNATNKNVTWSSSDPSVVSVDATGTIKALKAGTSTITVKTEDGGKTASCTITVKSKTTAVTGVKLNKTTETLTQGSSLKLTATVNPSNASNKSVTWSSSDTKIATVDSKGNVKAVKPGTAKITAKTSNGKTAECEVQVNADSFTGVKKDGGQLKRFRSGAVDTAYTGLDQYPEDGKWYYFAKGIHDATYTGLAKSTNGKFYYVKNGMWDTTYTGFAKYTDGKWYFVKNGRYDTSYTGLAYSEPSKGWFYSDKGVYNNKYTGIAKSTDGKLYYARNGRWDTSYTGLAQYTDGKWYYVKDGRHQTYTGVCKSTNGLLYYAKNGVWDTSYTGLAQYHADGKWYFVKNGRHEAYTGVCKSTNGLLYYAKNGVWDTSYTGLAQYHVDGKWYFVKNGRREAYTGVCKSTNGLLYYAKNGLWDTSYTGLAQYHVDGKWYYVKNGRHEAYTGVCKSTNGLLYYAKNGVWDTTFTGSAKNESGTVYNVKNGRV